MVCVVITDSHSSRFSLRTRILHNIIQCDSARFNTVTCREPNRGCWPGDGPFDPNEYARRGGYAWPLEEEKENLIRGFKYTISLQHRGQDPHGLNLAPQQRQPAYNPPHPLPNPCF